MTERTQSTPGWTPPAPLRRASARPAVGRPPVRLQCRRGPCSSPATTLPRWWHWPPQRRAAAPHARASVLGCWPLRACAGSSKQQESLPLLVPLARRRHPPGVKGLDEWATASGGTLDGLHQSSNSNSNSNGSTADQHHCSS